MNHIDLLESAVEACMLAGEILRSGYGTRIEARYKDGSHNLVTDYDTRCEEGIRRILLNSAPASSFLGEESGLTRGSGKIQWIVDPLDGTVNFAHGIPIFCVSIAAQVDEEIVAGAIYHPLLGELFTATKGAGAFLNGRSISVSGTERLDDSFLVTGFPYNVAEDPLNCINQFAMMLGKGLPIRRLGSAALDLAYVADGRFDGYWEVSLHPWDMAAGVLLVTEAGGTVTRYHGEPFSIAAGSIVATNGGIHKQLVAQLSEVSD